MVLSAQIFVKALNFHLVFEDCVLKIPAVEGVACLCLIRLVYSSPLLHSVIVS